MNCETKWCCGGPRVRQIFHAVEGDTVIGQAIVNWSPDETCQVLRVEVHPDHQRQGVYTALYDAIHEAFPQGILGPRTFLPDGYAAWVAYADKRGIRRNPDAERVLEERPLAPDRMHPDFLRFCLACVDTPPIGNDDP